MLITLFTDASWRPDSKSASWGAWAKSGRGKTEGGGKLKSNLPSSNAAELQGAANGIHLILRSGIAQPGDSILLQLDNQHVIRVLQGKHGPQGEDEVKAHWWICQTLRKYQLCLHVRHIKGHAGTSTPRTWVNNRCDRIARQHNKREPL